MSVLWTGCGSCPLTDAFGELTLDSMFKVVAVAGVDVVLLLMMKACGSCASRTDNDSLTSDGT